jgi:GntR family transcriptional regulator/MocR family aminotransferase
MSSQRPRPSVLLNWIRVDRRSQAPLYRQVADQIRHALLAGRIGSGELLPASRALALDLGVSRITTLQAYDQLTAEGFLETRQGSGTRVAIALAQKPLVRSNASCEPFRSQNLQQLFSEPDSVEFQPGIPAFDAFPRLRWSRLLQRHGSRNDPSILDYAHVGGYAPLRQELAKYLAGSRGVDCRPEQVIVVTCTRAAVAATCSLLWGPGTEVAVEDPGYKVVQRVLLAAGHRLRHVAVDAHGMQVDELLTGSDPCVGAYVTAAHQWPTGVTLAAERRIALLDWAARTGAWIIEDDYDSEFRFDSPPVATLHSFGSGRVVYVGTFSKTLVPSIRTAYLVVPPEAVGSFERQVFKQGLEPPLHVQAALADFLAEGDFCRHVARMRKLYAQRRDLLVRALRRVFDGRLAVDCPPGGLQLIAMLPERVADVAVSRRAAEAGIVARPLSNWHVHQPAPNALQLGFAAVPEHRIEPAVSRLHDAISDLF